MVGEYTVYVGARAALFDTLYKSVALPSEVAKEINEFLEPTGNIGPFTTVDCKRKHSWPNITFAFGSTQLVLRSDQYLAQMSEDGRDHCVSIFTEADPIAFPIFILGLSFISKFDTMFDLDLMRVGFASPGQ
ncbi:cathepsin D [Clonorchis sinensis]|uniref:Cathepsin D n=1 Tax=Clonorchis sinensis TaxID=79923 RepID=G7YSA5_CLOSI|nr:cathepsin D [Clonorchis sinensis]